MAKIMKKTAYLSRNCGQRKEKKYSKNKTFGISVFGILQYKLQFLQVECVEMIRRIPWVYPYFEKETLCRVLNLNVRVCRKS